MKNVKLNIPINKNVNKEDKINCVKEDKILKDINYVENKSESNLTNNSLFTPLQVSNLIKLRLIDNKLKIEESIKKLEIEFKLQLQSLKISSIVREDEILKSFIENSGFDYESKYMKDEDFSFVHILNKKEKD